MLRVMKSQLGPASNELSREPNHFLSVRTRGSTAASEFFFPFKAFRMTVHLSVAQLVRSRTKTIHELPATRSAGFERALAPNFKRDIPAYELQELPPMDKGQGILCLRDDAVCAGFNIRKQVLAPLQRHPSLYHRVGESASHRFLAKEKKKTNPSYSYHKIMVCKFKFKPNAETNFQAPTGEGEREKNRGSPNYDLCPLRTSSRTSTSVANAIRVRCGAGGFNTRKQVLPFTDKVHGTNTRITICKLNFKCNTETNLQAHGCTPKRERKDFTTWPI
ncbi:hypothetical protein C8F01DRAFT_1083426 [Mycena amicta]|nr:hypothetical protein C8F01DRAFT_1083426 [Mycena amicta]